MKLIIVIFFIWLFAYYKPFDECREYSSYNCEQIEKAKYNVYFYFPEGQESSLGQSTGLAECGSMARSYAYSKNNPTGWSYICCMKTDKSSCEEKHR